MLALLVLPFLVAIAFWILSAWFLWDPVTGWFQTVVFQGDGWMARGYRQVSPYGLGGLSTWIPNLFAFLLLVPIAIATALALIALLAMPMVVRHLGSNTYPDVARRGSLALGANLWNVLKSVVVFVVGYLVTMPLWLIPPLALIVPWLWWGWLTARLMRFDSLVEHAGCRRTRAADPHRPSRLYAAGAVRCGAQLHSAAVPGRAGAVGAGLCPLLAVSSARMARTERTRLVIEATGEMKMSRQDARHAADVRRIGALIIGDEILSGKRQDKHLVQLIAMLVARGLRLTWARYLGDEHELLVDALEQSLHVSRHRVLVRRHRCDAGRHDPAGRSAGAWAGRSCCIREASTLIAERCADMAREGKGSADMTTPENRQRLKMGEFPEGAAIIPNSFNRIPGFNIEDHWFVPGLPGDGLADGGMGAGDALPAPVPSRRAGRPFAARLRNRRVGGDAAARSDRSRFRRHQGLQPAVGRRERRAAPHRTGREGRGRRGGRRLPQPAPGHHRPGKRLRRG